MRAPTISAIVLLGLLACSAPPPPAKASSAPTTPAPPATTAAPTQSAATPATSASGEAPARIAAQHVLLGYKGTRVGTATRSKKEAMDLAEEVRKKALAGEDFAKLAQTYSDDPASKERLGSVGTFTRDGMVKEFSDAAFALKVGEVSPVVETHFGFHVIKRNQ